MGKAAIAIEVVALIAVLALLWFFPLVLFPHPATNDAIWLSDLELPMLLVGMIGLVLVLIRRTSAVRLALGVFLLGTAADFQIGLMVFGNNSNDRFAALVFFPYVAGLTGLVVVAVGIALSAHKLPDLLIGGIFGVVAAMIVGVWILGRGGADWLLAPYGFDVFALILVVGTGVVLLVPGVRTVQRG